METHLTEATKRFDQVLGSDDDSLAQNVPEIFLEPIRCSFSEPDFSVLDKPVRPPARPEAPNVMSPVMNGQNGRLSESDDPFSNQSVSPAEAQNLFSNDDAFASFNKSDNKVILKQLLRKCKLAVRWIFLRPKILNLIFLSKYFYVLVCFSFFIYF